MNRPKIAIVHDYLREYGGGEKVVEALNEVWPSSPVYTSTYNSELMSEAGFSVPQGLIQTSFIQHLPFRNTLRKHYSFLYPAAFRMLKIDADIIISSCSYASKFVKKPKGALHICYLHSVPKFLWGYPTETPDLETVLLDRYLKPLYKAILPPAKNYLKKADYQASQEVDFFIANSSLTAERIKKHYGRDSKIIYPPVDVEKFKGSGRDDGYFLLVSRLSHFKNIDLVIKAFNKIELPLKIVGSGQDLARLKSLASSNIKFLGFLAGDKLVEELRNCTALIFPTEEDFGITPVEAMAAGKPVIAFRGGGALETVKEGVTGEFFDKQSSDSLMFLLKRFDARRYNSKDCQDQAEKFSEKEFRHKIKFFVEEAWENKKT